MAERVCCARIRVVVQGVPEAAQQLARSLINDLDRWAILNHSSSREAKSALELFGLLHSKAETCDQRVGDIITTGRNDAHELGHPIRHHNDVRGCATDVDQGDCACGRLRRKHASECERNEVHFERHEAGQPDGCDVRHHRLLDRGDQQAVDDRAGFTNALRHRVEVQQGLRDGHGKHVLHLELEGFANLA